MAFLVGTPPRAKQNVELLVPPIKIGEAGIRTLDTLAGITVFETAAIDHSATSPKSSKNERPQGARLP